MECFFNMDNTNLIMSEHLSFLGQYMQEQARLRREKKEEDTKTAKLRSQIEEFKKKLEQKELEEDQSHPTEQDEDMPISLPSELEEEEEKEEVEEEEEKEEQDERQEVLVTEEEEKEAEEKEENRIKEKIHVEEQILTDEKLLAIIEQMRYPMSKKKKLQLIDSLSKFVKHPTVKDFFIQQAEQETITAVRVKIVAALADVVEDSDVQKVLLEKLQDPSPYVRQWAVWGLTQLIEQDRDILDRLIYHMLYRESSERVKLWILRALSRIIDNPNVEDVFLRMLKASTSKDIRSLIVQYLLNKLDDREICYALSRYILEEKDKEIKKAIIEKIRYSDNPDLQFALERLKRIEQNKEIVQLLE